MILFLTLTLLLSGCTPAGPRALLKGKKYLDRGDVTGAVAQFKKATTLLTTNASAWNYYGVALHRAGQPDDAANAYQTAIRLDRDLMEAHYNLGSLALEQNKPDLAKTEFTAYTLRRPNEAAAWLKLGFAQLKAGETVSAERSFSTVRFLKTNEAEAYNGLGLARLQRGKPNEAAQFFLAAVQARPDFAPALLNLATVNQQYLHDNKAALENYHSYLTLTPRPASYDEVKSIVAGLEQNDVAATVMAPAKVIKTSTPPSDAKPKIASVTTQHLASSTRAMPSENPPIHATPHAAVSAEPPSEPVVKSVPPETVQVKPEPTIITTPPTNAPKPAVVATVPTPATNTVATNVVVEADALETPLPEPEPRHGFFRRLFSSNKPSGGDKAQYRGDNLTPIPATIEPEPTTKPAESKPAEVKPTPIASLPRYHYTSPRKPAAGDRRSASGAFTKARLAEQDEKWTDAQQWYQTAAETDPSWFEAQYNTGVIAHRLRSFSLALPRYELALALQPDSVDARYNFALALKAAGYAVDAANEFKKILAASPDEVRAHLALANLCAQSLHDSAQARQHYVKVLALQPDNPQASDIRFWLSANPK